MFPTTQDVQCRDVAEAFSRAEEYLTQLNRNVNSLRDEKEKLVVDIHELKNNIQNLQEKKDKMMQDLSMGEKKPDAETDDETVFCEEVEEVRNKKHDDSEESFFAQGRQSIIEMREQLQKMDDDDDMSAPLLGNDEEEEEEEESFSNVVDSIVAVDGDSSTCSDESAAPFLTQRFSQELRKKSESKKKSSTPKRRSSPKKWRRMVRTHRLQSILLDQ